MSQYYVALRVKKDGSREILGFCARVSEGESASNWEEILQSLLSKEAAKGLFVADGLAALEDVIKRVFPGGRLQAFLLHAVRSILQKMRKRAEML